MANLQEIFDFFMGGGFTYAVIEETLVYFLPLLLNYLALGVFYVGFRETDLWAYFRSEKNYQAIFWSLTIIKVISSIACCLALTWKYRSHRCSVLLTLTLIVYMSGFAVGYYSKMKFEK
jgi:hypothetical protein